MNYDFAAIEAKWHKYWEENDTFHTDVWDFSKPKYYVLDMFPYPSGVGLHAGHPEGYTATDIMSRMKRMQGYNVLHPMGYDSFGLPAEQYAISTGNHPEGFTKKNIETFSKQLKELGFDYDWSKMIATSDPSFYKWTQWIFKQLYEAGYAKRIEMPVNWCEELGTVLSNDEVIDGKSERGKSDGQLSAMVHGVDAVITGTHEEDKQGGTGDVIRVSFIVVGTFLHEVDPSSGMFLQRDVFVLYPGKHFNKLLRGFLDDAVDIDQSLVGVVDDATDFRIGLSYSEEEGAATDKRFYIGIHLSEVFRKGFDKYGKQSSFTSHPGEAGFSRQVGRRTFLFFQSAKCRSLSIIAFGGSCGSSPRF